VVPEVIAFLYSAVPLLTVSENPLADSNLKNNILTIDYSAFTYIRKSLFNFPLDSKGEKKISWDFFIDESKNSNPTLACALLHTFHVLIKRVHEHYISNMAAPELLSPLLYSLKLVRPHISPAFPISLQESHASLMEKISDDISSKKSVRRPLIWRKEVKKAIEGLTPKYQENYAPTKDMDPDKGRVEMKQLNRQLKREKKAAVRELKRDADFLDQEKYKEQMNIITKRKEERAKNFAWMEEQQATLNQQVKIGKGLMKGGGSGIINKNRRVKR
jgi:nucleolar protein 14